MSNARAERRRTSRAKDRAHRQELSGHTKGVEDVANIRHDLGRLHYAATESGSDIAIALAKAATQAATRGNWPAMRAYARRCYKPHHRITASRHEATKGDPAT